MHTIYKEIKKSIIYDCVKTVGKRDDQKLRGDSRYPYLPVQQYNNN